MNKFTQLLLASASVMVLAHPAFADGGAGFDGGAPGVDSATGAGGTGASAADISGSGGGAGVTGGAGGDSDTVLLGGSPGAGGIGGASAGAAGHAGGTASNLPNDGAGGGGGAHGSVVTVTTVNGGTITGGAGGAGGNGGSYISFGGGGGAGGWGVVVNGAGLSYTNNGTISGGAGGAGGTGGISFEDGAGGSGGIGIYFSGAGTLTNTATDSITGGAGGGDGLGGVGVEGSNLTIINGGSISGGLGGGVRADSLLFTGGGNVLTLQSGNSFTGNIEIQAGTLIFNQSDAETLSTVITGAGSIIDSGSGTLTLSAANTYTGQTEVTAGMLKAGIANAFGVNSEVVLNTGTVLDLGGYDQNIGALTGEGSVNLGANTLTLSSGGYNYGGVINGTGGVTIDGAYETFNNANTYIGLTKILSGSLELGEGGSLASGNNVELDGGQLDVYDTTQVLGTLSGTGGSLYVGEALSTTLTVATLSGSHTVTVGEGGALNVTTYSADGSLFVEYGGAASLGTLTGNAAIEVGEGSSLDVTNFSSTGSLTLDSFSQATIGILAGSAAIEVSDNANLNVTSLTATGGSLTVDSGGVATIASLGGSVGIAANGTLIYGGAGNATYAGNLTGTTGTIIQSGTGVETLSGDNSGFTGSLYIDDGTLKLGSANALDTGNFDLDNGATLDLNGFSNTSVPAYIGTGGTITNNGAQAATLTIYTGEIDGAITDGTAKTNIVISDNSAASPPFVDFYETVKTYSGTTTILAGGNLQVGEGSGIPNSAVIDHGTLDISRDFDATSSAIKSLSGDGLVTLGANTLILTNASDTFSGVIQEAGGYVAATGGGLTLLSGTETLTGASTYTGATTVSGGTLAVNGSISQSPVTVANGGRVTGTGTLGAITIQSGGTLAPGNNGVGTIGVNGNLTLAPGSIYAVDYSASGLDRTNVTGTASVNGSLLLSGTSFSPGVYTLIDAQDGLTGTFSGLSGLSGGVRGTLSYDAKDAFLTLAYNALSPLLNTAATPQQRAVAGGIDAALAHGAAIGSGFSALFNLTGSALNAALNQIAGQIGPNVSEALTNGSFMPFLTAMFGQGVSTGGDAHTAANFAPSSVYGAVQPAQLVPDKLRVWGNVYGGHVGLSASGATGSAGISGSNVGGVLGAESQFSDGTLAGVSVSLGQQDFRSGNGTGNSTSQMIGVYGRTNVFGQGYIAAALGYGWHAVSTLRTITVSGTDVLGAHFDADEFGGRIEAGYRLQLDDADVLAPYAAFAGSSFETPAYGEHAVSGAGTFALNYASSTVGVTHVELGTHLGRSFALDDGTLSVEATAAWVHQLEQSPIVTAAFQGLAGSAFGVYGVQPANNTALLGVDFGVQTEDGFGYGVSATGQFGKGTTIVSGIGTLSYRW